MKRQRLILFGLALSTSVIADVPVLPGSQNLNLKAQLGQQLFFDTALSEPAGQACASCHDPGHAFTDADKHLPTSKGANSDLHGNRNAPTAMYAAYAPRFGFNKNAGMYIGGQFLDGRASTLSEQAKGPFLNPLEMANPDAEHVVIKVRQAEYASLFYDIYGPESLDDAKQAYDRIADAIAEFERSPVFNRFTSKYDFYLLGKATLTPQERRGLNVFEAGNKGNCAACHPSRPSNGMPPLFTDYSYDNLGVPKNPDNPFYGLGSEFNAEGMAFVDRGLGEHVKSTIDIGKIKVPTLRNVAITGPYMHNGYFQTLRGVVNFYSSRDTRSVCGKPLKSESQALKQRCWPEPEVDNNVNHAELGALNLSESDINDLVAFLKTLTDGYKSESPWPYRTPQKLN